MLRIYEVSLEIVRAFRPYLAELQRRSPHHADQLDRARTTTVLAIAEGSRSRGRNRPAHYARGCASMDESISITDVCVAKGCMPPVDEEIRGKMEHVVAVLVRVSR